MRKRLPINRNFSKKITELHKRSLAQEDVVNLEAYRSASKPRKSRTILLVDDDPVSLNTMKKIFESNDYLVFSATNAMEVSKIIADNSLDMILLDVHLPWMDGYELCSLLKSTSFLKDLPIALISKDKEEEDLRKGFESGCDGYITKPFEANELQTTVAKLIG